VLEFSVKVGKLILEVFSETIYEFFSVTDEQLRDQRVLVILGIIPKLGLIILGVMFGITRVFLIIWISVNAVFLFFDQLLNCRVNFSLAIERSCIIICNQFLRFAKVGRFPDVF